MNQNEITILRDVFQNYLREYEKFNNECDRAEEMLYKTCAHDALLQAWAIQRLTVRLGIDEDCLRAKTVFE